MANGNGWKAPHTETPELVLITLLAMGIVLGATLCFLLGNWWILGLITTFVILGCSTGLYTVGVPQYYAIIMMDNFWGGGKQRVVFQGVHLKYPWESPQLRGSQKDFINLRTEVSGVIKDETYPTSDGLVVGTYVFTMKINISDPDNASGNVLRWASYDSDAALRVLRALVSRTFSSFSETHKTEELIRMDNETVNKEAFPAGKAEIVEFEKKYGGKVSNDLTQGFQRTVDWYRANYEQIKDRRKFVGGVDFDTARSTL